MKFATVILAIAFNLTVLLLYSRGLVGGTGAAVEGKVARTPVAGRSASSPLAKADRRAEAVRDEGDGKATLAPVESGDGKELLDPKDGKAMLEPVAEEGQVLRLRRGAGQRSTELFPGERRGVLAPANPANVDPPVVSPEAR